jgi:hypothetical protein
VINEIGRGLAKRRKMARMHYMKRIVFMGTPEFAVPTLQTLIEHRVSWSAWSRSRTDRRGAGSGCDNRR